MDKIKVFLDSDVIISSLLSKTGASYEILKNPQITKVVSETIKAEVNDVARRLNIIFSNENIFRKMEVISLKLDKARLVKTYLPYVLDEEDSHVVAGVVNSKSRFLLTHNIKHYQVEKMKRDLEIITMKPGIFLQYLRSS